MHYNVGGNMGAPQMDMDGQRKVMERQQKMSYGDELRGQMAAQMEAKQLERMERMGIVPFGVPHIGGQDAGPPGMGGPGMGGPMGGPVGAPPFGLGPPFGPSLFGGRGMGPNPFMGGGGGRLPFGAMGGPPPHGGGFGLPYQKPPIPMEPGPNTMRMHRVAELDQKAQYRFELEQQMREKEERKAAEKARIAAEEMARENAVSPRPGDQGAPGGPPNRGGGMGPPSFSFQQPPGFGMGMMGAPPPFNPFMGMGMGIGPPMGTPGGPPGGAPPAFGGPVGQQPMAYGGMDEKKAAKMQLQADLKHQMAEKAYERELRRKQEEEQEAREEAQYQARRAGDQHQQQQGQYEGGPGNGMSSEEQVAAAWLKAKEDSEAAKRSKFARIRGGQRAADNSGFDGDGGGGGGGYNYVGNGTRQGQVQKTMVKERTAGEVRYNVMTDVSPVMVEQKARAIAADEVERVRAEMAAEAAALRRIVEDQSQQVSALIAHSERLEAEAAAAKNKISHIKQDLYSKGASDPAAMAAIFMGGGGHGAGQGGQRAADPSRYNVMIDLPPPASHMRRSTAALHPQSCLQAGEMPQSRPDTGMTLPGESVLLYPNGHCEVPSKFFLPPQGASSRGRMHAAPREEITIEQLAMAREAPLQTTSSPPTPATSSPLTKPISPTSAPYPAAPPEGELSTLSPLPAAAAAAAARQQQPSPRLSTSQPQIEMPSIRASPLVGARRAAPGKQQMMQELNKLAKSDNVDAMDAFLAKFANSKVEAAEKARAPSMTGVASPSTPNSALPTRHSYQQQHAGYMFDERASTSGQPPRPPPSRSQSLTKSDSAPADVPCRLSAGSAALGSKPPSRQTGGSTGPSNSLPPLAPRS